MQVGTRGYNFRKNTTKMPSYQIVVQFVSLLSEEGASIWFDLDKIKIILRFKKDSNILSCTYMSTFGPMLLKM